MKARDFREIGTWAVVTAVVAIGILGAGMAISQDDVNSAIVLPEVQGLQVSATVGAWDKVSSVPITITAKNPTAEAKKVELPVDIASREFKGNPGSRVFKPSDYVVTPLKAETWTADVPAGETRTYTIRFAPPKPKDAELLDEPLTYEVRLFSGKLVLANFGPPAANAPVFTPADGDGTSE